MIIAKWKVYAVVAIVLMGTLFYYLAKAAERYERDGKHSVPRPSTSTRYRLHTHNGTIKSPYAIGYSARMSHIPHHSSGNTVYRSRHNYMTVRLASA